MVNHIAVIGSGTMGRGVAYAAALAGFNVALQDIKQEAIDKAREYNESLANKSAEKGYIQSEQRDLIFNNITYTTDLKKLSKYRFSCRSSIRNYGIESKHL